jgi:DNA-binding winged helix-turn-helix (wHTH) protein
VPIGGRALELLALLASRPGEVLDNRMLIRSVWPRTVVEEVNLRVQIAALRKALGGDRHFPYIVNHAGRGYCFTAPVARLAALPPVRAGWIGEAAFAPAGGGRPADAAEGAAAATLWRDPGAPM